MSLFNVHRFHQLNVNQFIRPDEIHFALDQVTQPVDEPITLAEAKSHMRVDFDDDNALIDGYIAAARQWAEVDFMRRALLTQTWNYFIDAFPLSNIIRIPLPPLQSVTELVYTDENGVERTFPASDYVVDKASKPGRLALTSNASWPTVFLQSVNGVRIQFVAGFGDVDDVSRQIRNALLLLIGDLYEHRENSIVGAGLNLTNVSFGVESLLTPFRIKTNYP